MQILESHSTQQFAQRKGRHHWNALVQDVTSCVADGRTLFVMEQRCTRS